MSVDLAEALKEIAANRDLLKLDYETIRDAAELIAKLPVTGDDVRVVPTIDKVWRIQGGEMRCAMVLRDWTVLGQRLRLWFSTEKVAMEQEVTITKTSPT